MTEQVEEVFEDFLDGHAPETFDEESLILIRMVLDDVVPSVYEDAFVDGYLAAKHGGNP